MFKKLRTVIYHTPDLQRAKEWYSHACGVSPYFDEPYYVGFNINGSELGLDPNIANAEEGSRAVAYWQVDDIEDELSKLLAAGATVHKSITDVGQGIKVAVIKDPFGNALGLIEEPE